jgi:hypothetical protein
MDPQNALLRYACECHRGAVTTRPLASSVTPAPFIFSDLGRLETRSKRASAAVNRICAAYENGRSAPAGNRTYVQYPHTPAASQ